MFKRAYIEITNICNLACSFCIGTKRPPQFMSVDDFLSIARQVRTQTDYLYLHVMGEPLLHPDFGKILSVASTLGFQINLTTNGTLLSRRKELLLSCPSLRKVSVSLHSFEGNEGAGSMTEYLDGVWDYISEASAITELRLWNGGSTGKNQKNAEITDFFSQKLGFDVMSVPEINGNRKLGKTLNLASADVFEWPSLTSPLHDVRHCYGLRTQFAVLCDGTVVPCCLDSDGSIPLGNALTDDLNVILHGERAAMIAEGFRSGQAREELCKRCGYATRFTKEEKPSLSI